jgi:hypothetical protein
MAKYKQQTCFRHKLCLYKLVSVWYFDGTIKKILCSCSGGRGLRERVNWDEQTAFDM